MIQVISDGTKPGLNLFASATNVLQVFFGYRWKKFGAFVRFVAVGPDQDWFNVAAGIVPTYTKTADAVNSFAILFTARLLFTISVEFQMRVGVRNPDALAAVVKKIMDDVTARGHTPILEDQTNNQGMAAAIDAIADKTPKGKLN